MQRLRASLIRIGAIVLISICASAFVLIAHRSTLANGEKSVIAAARTTRGIFDVSDFSSRFWFQYYQTNFAPAWNGQLSSADVCDPFHGDTYRVVREVGASKALLVQVSYAGGVGSLLSSSRHFLGPEPHLKLEPFAGSSITLEQMIAVQKAADALASAHYSSSSHVFTELDFAAQNRTVTGVDDSELFGPGNIFIEVCREGNYSWYQRTQPNPDKPDDKEIVDFANLLLATAHFVTYPYLP